MTRDFHFPGRSPVLAAEGMVATSHPIATLAAIETLRAGGTAADAAVTASALLCVVEPAMTGIGGDCFWLVAKPGQAPAGYNGSGRAGAAMTVDALTVRGVHAIAGDSIHAVTVPGAIDAWNALLQRHGRFGLDRALQPAIHYAEEGFAVAPRVGTDWALAAEKLRADAGAARHYLPGGRAPKTGEQVRFPALAETLRTIAKGGRDAFYSGPIAQDIADTVAAHGGLLTAADLAAHRGNDVVPISTNYRGLDLVEIPPNGQGITALLLLNILANFEIGILDPTGPQRYHLALEAARLAYAVRDLHIADPDFMRVTVEQVLDRGFAASLAKRIDPEKRMEVPRAITPGSDTVYLTVVDRDRTAVSFINSLFSPFGVGVATEKTGIMLQNRGSGFVVDPAHPNCVAPNKRPLHTIIPALAMRNGRCEMSFGVMGGAFQGMGHAQVVSNVVDYNMDVQAAIDLPRIFFDGEKTLYERSVPAATLEGLKRRGHDLAPRPLPHGGGQAIRIDWERGVLIGGSDARKDGCALGY